MNNKKVWIAILVAVVVVAGVLIGVFINQKNTHASLAADLQHEVDAVKTELEKVKTDAENALATAKKDADGLIAAAKSDAEKLIAEKDTLIEQIKADAENAAKAAKDEADRLIAEKDALIEKVKADVTAAAKADAEKLIAEKDALIEKVKADAEAVASAAKEEADKLVADKDILIAQIKADAESAVKAAKDEVARLGAEKDEAVNQARIEVETAAKANAQKALDEIQARLDEAIKAKETAEQALAELQAQAAPAALVTSLPVVVETTPAPVEKSAAKAGEAFLMFVDGAWDAHYWNDGKESTAVAGNVMIDQPGAYEVSLAFPEDAPAQGLSLLALGVGEGNIVFPNYVYEINEVLVNGEAIAVGRSYTTSEDQIESRANIMNEWVKEIPADARTADGSLEGCSAVIVDKNLFTDVRSIVVRFTVVEVPAVPVAP